MSHFMYWSKICLILCTGRKYVHRKYVRQKCVRQKYVRRKNVPVPWAEGPWALLTPIKATKVGLFFFKKSLVTAQQIIILAPIFTPS